MEKEENHLEESENADDDGSEQTDAKVLVSDDSIVNIADHFELEKLVKEQIIIINNKAQEDISADITPHSRTIKDRLFNACIEALGKSVENAPAKVRGLPLHEFVFTDINILEAAQAHVRRDKIDVKLTEGVTGYFCTFAGDCDFMSEEKNVVTKHVMDCHTAIGAFVCKGCGKRFTVKDRAYRHIQTEHVLKQMKCLIKENFKVQISCQICGLVYKKEAGLRSHISNVHEKEKDLHCSACDFVTKDYLELRKHRKDEHGHGHRSCHICGKQFTSQVGFEHHVANTHGDGSFPCEDCGEVFKTMKSLKDHRKKHVIRTCICDECGAKFHTPFAVKKHKRMHGSDFPFPCNLCTKRFRDAGPLKEHMYKHTGERPYQCTDCEANFNQGSAFRRHIKVVHSGIRPYPCKICSFRGGQPYDLVRHIKSVHNMSSSSGNGGEISSSM
eukprot:GFUD01001957.1.p1 GENE.GFUD01001957.1~~GFUD01001957.1.p1  ORF type:complete len:489 (+),score=78.24 GFUD01001957.1:141-1469(+)